MRQLFIPGLLLLTLLPLPAAEQDARQIEDTIGIRHLPYGTVLDPVLNPDGSVASYTHCGDSATWTGHYLAAEAFRYHVTASPQALANIRTALAGLALLTGVTGNNTLARCAIPADSPYLAAITSEEQANGTYSAALNGRRWVWIGNTSRDQYSGVFFGLVTAYDLARDLHVRRDIQALAGRLLGNLQAAAWNVVFPNGAVTTFLLRPDQQLALLQIGAHVDSARFASDYARAAASLAPAVPVPAAYDAFDDNSSYFKFNLDFINLYSLIRLETNASNKAWYERAFASVRAATNGHLNPHFNMIDRALHGPDPARDAETRADLDAWLLRPRLDVFVDWRGKVKTCGNNQACDPLPVPQRPPADFLWQRSPFLLYGGQKGNIEAAGIDYLLPYWMARYYGVIGGGAGASACQPATYERLAGESACPARMPH